MTDILASLNRCLQMKQHKVMLFMDNAPCHPVSLQDKLSNINIVFLPKKTTLKTQPLDSGIIAIWKCIQKKRLLCHGCSKADGSNSVCDIVKSVNFFMSIKWGRQAWDDCLENQLSDVSKEMGCTLMKTGRTILLREKHFQDCRYLLRQWKHPVLQKSFKQLNTKLKYALVSLTQQIENGEKRQEKKF